MGSTPAGRTFSGGSTGQRGSSALTPAGVEFYVLKNGRSEGPFSESDLVDSLSTGRYSPEDLAQEDGARHWTPLRRLLAGDSDPAEELGTAEEVSPEAQASAESAGPETPSTFGIEGNRFWRNTRAGATALISRFPYESGIALCVAGIVVLILSYARILIVGPVLLAALIAGGLTMLRGRVMGGLAICAAAIFIPAAIWSIVQLGQRMLH